MILSDDPKASQRFWAKVARREDGCWNWCGALTSRNKRYGYFTLDKKNYYAHRLAFEDQNECKIKDKMVIDHLCENTKCVNPQHMEVVSNSENLLRGSRRSVKIKCKNGHFLLYPSLRALGGQVGVCDHCYRIRSQKWYFKVVRKKQVLLQRF